MATTAVEIQTADNLNRTASPERAEITYFYGIRGVSSVYIVYFHLNNIILAAFHGSMAPLYGRLTDWMRVGDFRVSSFFVISGYLLTLPTLKSPNWDLSAGVKAFFARRIERLLFPYYVALVLSILLFVVWRWVVHVPLDLPGLAAGTLAHVLMIHNLHPRTTLYINDTLWNVGLEFQCYVLFVFLLLPLMRRFGPWAQLGAATVIGLGPHFLMGGFLDWTRPWLFTLYAMGVAAAALGNRSYPKLTELQTRIPWGRIWLVTSVATIVAIARSRVDAPYGEGLLQNILLGCAISSLIIYAGSGFRGRASVLARPLVRCLEHPVICGLGRFSYSTYLIHYPILRLAIALTALATGSIWLLAAVGFFLYAPLTVAAARAFHCWFERPFQKRRRLQPEAFVRGTEERRYAN